MARYEMLWDCPRCDTKGLLGLSHRHCPSCGAAQDPTKRYFPPEDQKVAVEDHPFHGRDLTCPACDSPNARAAHCCVNCGAPLDGAKDVRLVGEAATPKVPPPPTPDAATPKKRAWWPWVLALAGLAGLALIVCLGLVGVEVFGGGPGTLTVSARSWERTVEVQEYRAVRDSAWDEAVPAGAREVRCSREQRDTRQVPDGQECHTEKVEHGDGTYSEEQRCTTRYRGEPVYDDKCSYVMDRWVTDHVEKASGTTDPPRWPAPMVGGTGLGATREGTRAATYTVTVATGAETWPCVVDETRWATMTPGSMWTTTMGGLSGDPDCDALAPLR